MSTPTLDYFFVPFARVDTVARTVEGYAFTTPTVAGDKWNLKRESLERAAPRYMLMPCVRSMHQPLAAGKATQVLFDDKGAFIKAYIGDAAEFQKCVDGIYRGFSIGGRPLITRGNDIEEFDWIETSLVDRPKDPGALFTVVRVEDDLANATTLRLLPNATDAELEIARRGYNNNQPRNERGRWSGGSGAKASPSSKPKAEAPKPAPDKSKSKPKDSDVVNEAGKQGLHDHQSLIALLDAHHQGLIDSHELLHGIIVHAVKAIARHGGRALRHVVDAIKAHVKGGEYKPSKAAEKAQNDGAHSSHTLDRWKAALKHAGSEAVASFKQGYREGKALVGRAELEQKRDAVRAAAQSETDDVKRSALVTEWMRLDGHLTQIF